MISIQDIVKRLADISTFHDELNREVHGMEALLGEAVNRMDDMNQKLKDIQKKKPEITADLAGEQVGGSVRQDDVDNSPSKHEIENQDLIARLNEAIDAVRKPHKQDEPAQVASQPEPVVAKEFISTGESAEHLKEFLQGSINNSIGDMGERLEQKLVDLLQHAKNSMASGRSGAQGQDRNMADESVADLSRMFMHGKIENNIEDAGVEEVESRVTDRSLERLRRMRESA